ncbi:MAG: molybdopterin molybdotransferase MoeA [Thaumarchaeota archaeon]|nr:molybdopterin molybdotransferase MoeA [Candidatus Calditenuaceae archaeon]MDW8041198.1 molybdopterin molybdotransferase MoeA [Nitrososphaerota archaeon]
MNGGVLKLIPLADAQRAAEFAGSRRTLERARLPIEETTGMVLSETIVSNSDIPNEHRAALDGFATCFDFLSQRDRDGLVRLRLSADAGEGPWAVSVVTGQVLPRGSDLVVRREHARLVGESLVISGSHERWENVERRGAFYQRGETIIDAGEVLRPAHIALLSEQGLRWVEVFRHPRCEVISIGDELLAESYRSIPNDFAHVIASYLRQLSCEVSSVKVVPDDVEELLEAVDAAMAGNDLVVTLGRSSVGRNDLVPKAYSEMEGAEVLFHGVRIHPGKPTGMVLIDDKCWLILPGSLTAAIAGLHLIGVPYLRSLMRVKSPLPGLVAQIDGDMHGRKGISSVYFASLSLEGGRLLARTLPKGVNNLYTASKAEAYAVLQPDETRRSGESVGLWFLGRLTY